MLPVINTFLIVILYVLLGLMIYRPNVYVNLNINDTNIPVIATEKQQPTTTKQHPTTITQQPTTINQQPSTTKQVRFNDELMVEPNNTKQYAGCTGVFNGNHNIYIQDDNEYKLLNNVMDKHRNNRIHSIRSPYRNRQNYPLDVEMFNVVID